MAQHEKMTHAVRRVTDEDNATAELDKASAAGYRLLEVEGGGADGNAVWLIFGKPAKGERPRPCKHVVRRATNADDAANFLNEASKKGFTRIASEGGGGNGNVLWLFFARSSDIADPEEAPPQPPAPPKAAGGSFDDDEGDEGAAPSGE